MPFLTGVMQVRVFGLPSTIITLAISIGPEKVTEPTETEPEPTEPEPTEPTEPPPPPSESASENQSSDPAQD